MLTGAYAVDDRPPVPPAAPAKRQLVRSPHGVRVDEYYWLRDDTRSDQRVIAHLREENAYREAILAPTRALQDRLFREMVARVKLDDVSVPYRYRGDWYYSRYEAAGEYPIHARRRGSLDGPEQVLLDEPSMAGDDDYFDIGGFEISPNGRWLAWTEDRVGRGQYTLRVRDLETNQELPDAVEGVESDLQWSADGRVLVYIEQDLQTLLGARVRCHALGADPSSDRLLYEETDPSFHLSLDASKDEKFLFIHCISTLSSEQRYARADDPALAFRVLCKRAPGHQYEADHFHGRWIICTNHDAPNFRLAEAPVGRAEHPDGWVEILAHRSDAFVEGFDLFEDFLAIEERVHGLKAVRVRLWNGAADFYLEPGTSACSVELGENAEMDSPLLRYRYTSLAVPEVTCDYDVHCGSHHVLKREAVMGGFDPEQYRTERLSAPARDGESIPVTVIYRNATERNGSAPLLQYAYGAYGLSSEPHFDSSLLSLLDRGFVYAIAHVRGGQELGRRWYEEGRLLKKKNTFTDFLDVTDFLVARGYADPGRVFASGSSAGGLLIGVIANMAPDRYRALVTHVPFMDVVTTMLDESVPLTTIEYDEWGDPRDPAHHAYMLSYSPYDNLQPQDYPAVFASTGLWDSQVQYFEPAKWVAKLRKLKTNDVPVLLRVDLGAGHAGCSSRFEQYRELAEVQAFLLDQAGIRE